MWGTSFYHMGNISLSPLSNIKLLYWCVSSLCLNQLSLNSTTFLMIPHMSLIPSVLNCEVIGFCSGDSTRFWQASLGGLLWGRACWWLIVKVQTSELISSVMRWICLSPHLWISAWSTMHTNTVGSHSIHFLYLGAGAYSISKREAGHNPVQVTTIHTLIQTRHNLVTSV